MVPTYKNPDRTEYGHDVEGDQYKVVFKNDKEVSRTRTGVKIIWTGGIPANFGIKQFKKAARKRQGSAYMIDIYKQNSWNSSEMKDFISKTALKAVPKAIKKIPKKTLEKTS